MAKPIKHQGKWRIRPIDANGKRLSEVFDTHADAQRRLKQVEHEREEVLAKIRPYIDHRRGFDDLADYWLENRAPYKRSQKDDESIIRAHLRPFFGGFRLNEIGTADGDRYIAAKRSAKRPLSEKTILNHIRLLNSMLRLGVDLGWLGQQPRIKVPRVSLFSLDYRYLRTHDEMQRFLSAARDYNEMAFMLYATAIYTGMRQGELAALQWDCVDLQRRQITVQRSFDGPTKSGAIRHVPILDALLPHLQAWRLRHPGTLLFTNRNGEMFQSAAYIFKNGFRGVLRKANLPERVVQGKARGYITFHDLRHTFASQWVSSGGDIFKLQKILGHQSTQMTMRYAHLAPNAFAADYNRLPGIHMEDAAVVPLREMRTM